MAGETKAEQRIYRTNDGQLVRENDPRGVCLAYPVGEPIKAAEVDVYRQLVEEDAVAKPAARSTGRAGTKAAAKPADKATEKPGDK